jgi:hypothetical protein
MDMSNILFRLHCPNCGGQIEETDIFCPHCGLSLDTPPGKSELETLALEYLQNARDLLERGRSLKKALAACDQAITCTPESAEAYNLRGLILDGLARTTEAILAYRQALLLDPNFADAQANLDDALKENRQARLDSLHAPAQGPKRIWAKMGLPAAIIALLVCLFAAGGLAYYFGRPYLASKTTMIFEPDRSRVSAVSQADLQQTALILKQRWSAIGYPGTSFNVSNNGQIIGRIPADVTPDVIDRTKAVGIIEFVDFGSTYVAVGKLVNTDLTTVNYPPVDGPKWHTIMTGAEIKTVSISRDRAGNYQIDFTLTEKGRKIFADHTTQNIGRYLGITLDKGVVTCPSINGAITSGSGQITGLLTYETANTLAAYMRYSPLPIPLK